MRLHSHPVDGSAHFSQSRGNWSLVVRGVPVSESRWCGRWRDEFISAVQGLRAAGLQLGESELELYFFFKVKL